MRHETIQRLACETRWGSYHPGPTACVAHPKVMKNIVKELKAARASSAHEVRLAAAMGLAPSDALRRLGFNDDLFYPPTEAAEALPARRPVRVAAALGTEALAPAQPRTLHAIALLVDFKDNKGTRPAADF